VYNYLYAHCSVIVTSLFILKSDKQATPR